jgi:RNA 3'-terminal phosphate cyclase (ATP)
LPLALAGGGAYVTLSPSPHLTTNVEIVRKFLDVSIAIEPLADGRWQGRVG